MTRISAINRKVIYWSIAIIPFVASFSSAAVEIFIGFLVLAFIVKKISERDFKVASTPLNLPFLLLIFISLASFVNSVNIHSSIQGIVKLLKYGSLLVIIAGELQDKKHLKIVVGAALLGLLLSSLDGVYQLIFGVDFFRHKPYDTVLGLARLKAAFPHTNIFAGYLALFVPLCITLVLYYLKGKKRIAAAVVALSGVFCLIFTFSRSAIFGVWFVLLLIGLIRRDKLVIFATIASLIIAPFATPGSIKKWANTTSSLAEFLLNKERFVLYETSFNMIRHHPLVGVGVNTYCLNYQKYKLHDTSLDTADTNWYAHNNFLQMAGEIGLSGLFVFLWLLCLLFKRWFGFYRKSADHFLRLCSLGVAGGILAFLIHGLTETNLYYPKIAVLFWFETALLMGILRLNNKQKETR